MCASSVLLSDVGSLLFRDAVDPELEIGRAMLRWRGERRAIRVCDLPSLCCKCGTRLRSLLGCDVPLKGLKHGARSFVWRQLQVDPTEERAEPAGVEVCACILTYGSMYGMACAGVYGISI